MGTSVQPTPDPFAAFDAKYGAPVDPSNPFAAFDAKYGYKPAAPAKPGVGAQIKSGLSDVGHAFLHPINTLESMGKSVASDVGKGFFTPVVGTENIPSSKSGQLPRPNLPVGATVTAQNTPGAISSHEAGSAALRSGVTAGLFAVPELALPGRLALNAGAGALYNPQEPIRGAVAGAVLGEALHGALHGPGAAARALDTSGGAVEHAFADYAKAASGTSPAEVTDRSTPAPGSAAALALERGKLPSADRPTPTIVEPGPAPKPKGKQPAPSLIQPATDYLGGGRTIDKNPLVTPPDEAAAAPSSLVDAQGNPVTAPKTRPRAGARVPLPGSVTGDPFADWDAKYGSPATPETPAAFAAFDAKYPEASPPAEAKPVGTASQSARYDSGALKKNLSGVSDEALHDELLRMYSNNASDHHANAELVYPDEATGIERGYSMQSRMKSRLENRQRTIDKIETELKARGHTSDDITDGLYNASLRAVAKESGIVDQHGQPIAPHEAEALLLNHAGSEHAGETLGQAGAGQGDPADAGQPQAAGSGPGQPVGAGEARPDATQVLPANAAQAQAEPVDAGYPPSWDEVTAPPSLLNERTLNVSPAAQPAFEAAKQRLADEGFQKERVSMGAQRAGAADFAAQLGISPLDLDPKKVARMSGPEIERVKELAGQHMDMIAQLSKELADPTIDPARAVELNSLLDEARDQNHAALQAIVRGSAQIGRDLGYLRQVAQHSLDPDVWVVQAQRLAGGARLSDETIADVRRLAREAADACAGAG